METTRLSSKGQIIIPKAIRQAYKWPVGQEFLIEQAEQGILLRPQAPFPQTCVDEVAGCLRYEGRAKTLEDMNNAIRRGVLERVRDCC